jgi:hypothetical protein
LASRAEPSENMGPPTSQIPDLCCIRDGSANRSNQTEIQAHGEFYQEYHSEPAFFFCIRVAAFLPVFIYVHCGGVEENMIRVFC